MEEVVGKKEEGRIKRKKSKGTCVEGKKRRRKKNKEIQMKIKKKRKKN